MQPDRLLTVAPPRPSPELEIAGVRFSLHAPGLRLARENLPSYREFRSGQAERAPVREVTVRLRAGAGRLPPGARRLFTAAQSYTVWRGRDTATRWFRHHPPALARPRWTARLGAEGAEVHCGPSLVRTVGDARELIDPCTYPLDQFLTVHYLAGRGLLLHAGGAESGGRAVVYAGVSGAGKTTLSRILAREGLGVFSDDRMVVRRQGDAFAACGTPWPGEGGFARNREAPLAAVLFLGRGARTRVRPLGAAEALRRLAPVASIPWYDREAAAAALEVCDHLLRSAPVFELELRPGPGAAAVVARLLTP